MSCIRIAVSSPCGMSMGSTGGRKVGVMLGESVLRKDFETLERDPSVGMKAVTCKRGWSLTSRLENSRIGIRWLNPGPGTTAM